ncbi:unnamed protein product [Arabis nemorensis]|uniref:Uncharacterized protein n=1 Tax=Arabis nemorensis TaxID=586526 RepID=A0A565CM17_9BRAS|nr:unnamed protein product [Arabis nemorensis]
MRVDLHELKLYVVPLPKHMTLQIDDFSVIPVNHGFAYAELVKGHGKESSGSVERVQSLADNIVLTQPQPEKGDTRKEKSIAWLGDTHRGDSGALSSGLKRYKSLCGDTSESRSLDILVDSQDESDTGGSSRGPTMNLVLSIGRTDRGTNDFPSLLFQPSDNITTVDLPITDLPAYVFGQDAAPVVDDLEL